jgi:NAD(P)-dependent dehydrogenase (short-subunit alcohol dehydrogenase family)
MKKCKIAITGSTGLLGKAVTKHFRSLNNYEVLEVCRKNGHDLTDERIVKEYFRENRPKYLINLFAANDPVDVDQERSTLFDVSLDSFRKFLETNVIALFSVCREFARNRQAEAIVNVSSIYGIVSPLPSLYDGKEKHVGYSASKGAVNQLSKHLAVHLAPRIRVNTLVLGGVKHNQGEDFIKKYSDHTPLKRMMQKTELNKLLEYLCSKDSSYMTGAMINVDGGWTAW